MRRREAIGPWGRLEGIRGRLDPPAQVKGFPLPAAAQSLALSGLWHQETRRPDSSEQTVPGKHEALEQGSAPTLIRGPQSKDTGGAGWGGGARVEGNELPVFSEGSERILMGRSWQGWRWEAGNSIAKTTRGSTVHRVYSSCRWPISSTLDLRNSKKRC